MHTSFVTLQQLVSLYSLALAHRAWLSNAGCDNPDKGASPDAGSFEAAQARIAVRLQVPQRHKLKVLCGRDSMTCLGPVLGQCWTGDGAEKPPAPCWWCSSVGVVLCERWSSCGPVSVIMQCACRD